MRLDSAEVTGPPTSEVVRKSDNTVVFEGSGQQCANYLFTHRGIDIMFRPSTRY